MKKIISIIILFFISISTTYATSWRTNSSWCHNSKTHWYHCHNSWYKSSSKKSYKTKSYKSKSKKTKSYNSNYYKTPKNYNTKKVTQPISIKTKDINQTIIKHKNKTKSLKDWLKMIKILKEYTDKNDPFYEILEANETQIIKALK